MEGNNRINERMNDTAVLYAMGEGNPGATTVVYGFRTGTEAISENILVRQLDELGIYGSRIWMLYKDVCGEDPVIMSKLLQAVSHKLLSEEVLRHAIDHHGEGVNIAEVVDRLHDHLKGQELCLS